MTRPRADSSSQNRIRGNLKSTWGEKGEKKETDQNPDWGRSFRFRIALEISVKNRLLAIKQPNFFCENALVERKKQALSRF
jgi:hypothetical protein